MADLFKKKGDKAAEGEVPAEKAPKEKVPRESAKEIVPDTKSDHVAAPPKKQRKPVRELTNAQKAAAVIVSLGAEKASLVYKHMEPDEVERVTVEVAKLGFLDSDQTEEVLGEYYQMCMTSKAVTEGGLEYARSVLEKAFGAQTATTLLDKVTKSLKNRDFAFINKAGEKDLFSVLQYERPQTIALVLSYVEPDKAAAVIEQLEGRRQIKVVESIAQMDSASPSAVKIIEQEMSQRFANIFSTGNVKVGGIDFVASIMNNLDRSSEKTVFDGLTFYDANLADEIRKRMFVFEDIITMDDRSVQRFVRDCDVKDLVLALKAANDEVADKLFSNMSSHMAENLRDDLEIATNVRMKDVEDAQQRIVGVIRELEERGEIVILKGGKDDIIA